MKHAGRETLGLLKDLLAEIRKCGGLKERGEGVFYFKSSAFLHFHEDPAGIYADIRAGKGWKRLRVNTAEERKALLREVKHTVSK